MRDGVIHGRGNQKRAAHDSFCPAEWRRDGHDLLHPGDRLRSAGSSLKRGEQFARPGAGGLEDRVPRGIPGSAALGCILDCAQQYRRCRSLSGRRGPAPIRGRPRSLSSSSVWLPAPKMENTVGGAAHPIPARGSVHLPGTGWHERERRLRRAGQHGRDHLFHSLPVFVRGDDQASARSGRTGCDPRAGREPGSETRGIGGIPDHQPHHCSVVDSSARRAQ